MGHHYNPETGVDSWWPDTIVDADEVSSLGEGWVDVGYLTEDGPSVFFSPPEGSAAESSCAVSEDWSDLRSFGLATSSFNREALDLIMGALVRPIEPDGPRHYGVVVEATDYEYGPPRRPLRVTGIWARLRGENRRRDRAWREAYQAWVLAGSPPREILTRHYIPRAEIRSD